MPDVSIQQIDKNNNITSLILLDTEGNTNIPNKLTAKNLELTNALPVTQGGTGHTQAGIDLLDALGIHVTSTTPTIENSIEGHVYLVYQEESE